MLAQAFGHIPEFGPMFGLLSLSLGKNNLGKPGNGVLQWLWYLTKAVIKVFLFLCLFATEIHVRTIEFM